MSRRGQKLWVDRRWWDSYSYLLEKIQWIAGTFVGPFLEGLNSKLELFPEICPAAQWKLKSPGTFVTSLEAVCLAAGAVCWDGYLFIEGWRLGKQNFCHTKGVGNTVTLGVCAVQTAGGTSVILFYV